jgi:hypothetical protein
VCGLVNTKKTFLELQANNVGLSFYLFIYLFKTNKTKTETKYLSFTIHDVPLNTMTQKGAPNLSKYLSWIEENPCEINLN